jgi:hypothetical protein
MVKLGYPQGSNAAFDSKRQSSVAQSSEIQSQRFEFTTCLGKHLFVTEHHKHV